MDLMKLLKAKSKHFSAERLEQDAPAHKIIANLKLQFEAFLRDIAALDEFKNGNPLEGVKCLSGDVILEDEYGVLGKSPYLYLRIPGHPGLLLEPGEETDTLMLFSATEARPIQRRWSGDVTSQVVFVRRPNPLAAYLVLETDTVRDQKTKQTFVGTRLFETLVERLILQINERSP
ncbi:MAG: hypothetical protein FJY29_12990 [Betaproteobacteria bacterium]|nr:hypothetical protein [Betaproteobacteria bacterium]